MKELSAFAQLAFGGTEDFHAEPILSAEGISTEFYHTHWRSMQIAQNVTCVTEVLNIVQDFIENHEALFQKLKDLIPPDEVDEYIIIELNEFTIDKPVTLSPKLLGYLHKYWIRIAYNR